MDVALRAQHARVVLKRRFTAIDDICFELPKGSVIGLIGPSGAGKTTLIRAIVGRQRLKSGHITIFGVPVGSRRLRKVVSYMTQETSVYNDLTVSENLRYFATMDGVPHKKMKAQVEQIIKTVGLWPQRRQMVSSLSGGQKQRVSLAIALIGSPRLLVLDEPTVGLDPVLREELWALFRRLTTHGVTLIISSHVMDEAERCDELLLIRDGKLLAQGSPKELREQTHTKSVEESFLALVKEPAS